MFLKVDAFLAERFPGLSAQIIKINGVKVEQEKPELESLKSEIFKQIREKWSLNDLREQSIFRAYRDFFWRIGVDPTKTRPAAEALIRRILHGRRIPKINTLVDAYNLASVINAVALAAFDMDKLSGEIFMREAKTGEKFLGIGMAKPIVLRGREVVVTDGEKLIAVYPYRDAEEGKITEESKRVLLLVCGVPGLEDNILNDARRVALKYVTRFCDGVED
jgi:DNA/RNA-binding domain of Phe-tRNA-synthetase-like protein